MKKRLTKPCMSETQIHCSATRAASPLLLPFPSEEEAEGTGEGGAEGEEGEAPLSLPASNAELLPLPRSLWCSIILMAPSKTLVMCCVLLETSREPRARERTE